MSAVTDRLTEYCLHGGLYKSEFMTHEKVRDLLHDCYLEITRLHDEIARLQADRETAVVQAESDYQHDIDSLRAEVERLRLTVAERKALVTAREWCLASAGKDTGEEVRREINNLLARHGGGE